MQWNSVNCTDEVRQASASKSTERLKAKLLCSWEYLFVIKCCSICENVILISDIIKPRVYRAASLMHHTTHRTWLWDRTCLLPGGTTGLPSPTHQCRNEVSPVERPRCPWKSPEQNLVYSLPDIKQDFRFTWLYTKYSHHYKCHGFNFHFKAT